MGGYGNGHEDLPTLDENSDGFNPYDSGEWYIDGNSHGTHCAGSIGALGDNSKGVVGVIPGSLNNKFSFFIGKGLTDSGSGSTSSVMAAVQACVDNGSNVISMSLGGGSPSDSVNQQYYGHYKEDDVLIIAAAGNSGNSALSYPASYKSVMSVAAVDSNENKAGFSQYNEQTEISGPGVSVKSTVTGNSGSTFSYTSYSGTSMATPHVAGVAGLLRMFFPDCKAFHIRNAMIVTAKDKGDAGCDVKYGHGIVQAKAAFEYLEANECDPNDAFKEPEGGCAEFSCTQDSDCDDGNPNTIDTCVSGGCQHARANNAACDDEDPCTADTCDNGECSNVFDCAFCGGVGCVLELTTDNYPDETAWDIKNSSGDEKYNGSGYSDKNKLHTINMCLETDEYTFYITDAYGDGICCSYGTGGYKIKVDGEEVVSGGEFGSTKTETFSVTSSPVAPPTTAPVDTPFPTTAPPTTAPVAPPTPTSDTCEMFVLSLTTDQFGYETSFELVNDLTGGIRLAGGLYGSSMTFEEVSCLTNGRYIFTVSDSHGDGICCDNGEGHFEVLLSGQIVGQGGDFGESQTFTFDVGPPGPTNAPTVAPTCAQADASCTTGDQCCSGRCRVDKCD